MNPKTKGGLAAALAMMAVLSGSPAAASGPSRVRPEPMRTSPARPRPSRDKVRDAERMRRAEEKRLMRERKRLDARAAGGWVSADAWLVRLRLRQAMAAADRELEGRLS